MGKAKRTLLTLILVMLTVFICSGSGWSQQVGMPHAFFNGLVETYLDNGVNDDLIFLYSTINSVVYNPGSTANPNTDSILGSTVTISGAKRTPPAVTGTTFTDSTISITDGSTTYFYANLINIEFVLIDGLWRLNSDLDINTPATLNLTNILLNPGAIPSNYILDLQTQLGAQNIAGMTMSLDTFSGDIASDSQSAILEGLISGVPAELSFIELDSATVKKDGKVKIAGSLALPAGVSHFNVNSIGHGIVGISSLGTVIDETVDFIELSNGNKWKYNAAPVFGISKFSIDWAGSKFNYINGLLKIKTSHIDEDETELFIISCSPVTVVINGVTIDINANDEVRCPHSGVKIDGDNDSDSDDSDSDDSDSDDSDSDGENSSDNGDDCTVGVRLPFALTPDMVIEISGSVTDSILVGDYYTATVGKFKLHGRFDATAIDFTSLTPWLETTITLGDEGFSGTLIIDDATWTKIKPKYWKYKSN